VVRFVDFAFYLFIFYFWFISPSVFHIVMRCPTVFKQTLIDSLSTEDAQWLPGDARDVLINWHRWQRCEHYNVIITCALQTQWTPSITMYLGQYLNSHFLQKRTIYLYLLLCYVSTPFCPWNINIRRIFKILSQWRVWTDIGFSRNSKLDSIRSISMSGLRRAVLRNSYTVAAVKSITIFDIS